MIFNTNHYKKVREARKKLGLPVSKYSETQNNSDFIGKSIINLEDETKEEIIVAYRILHGSRPLVIQTKKGNKFAVHYENDSDSGIVRQVENFYNTYSIQ